jgi:hypothetical protein
VKILKFIPKNYRCVRCEREQYTMDRCCGCGCQVFIELKSTNHFTLSLTEEELKVIKRWADDAEFERPMMNDEKELYKKLFTS